MGLIFKNLKQIDAHECEATCTQRRQVDHVRSFVELNRVSGGVDQFRATIRSLDDHLHN